MAAVPTAVVWAPGDGERVTCPGPGVAWAPGMTDDRTYCSHIYTRSSAGAGAGAGSGYQLSATVLWTLVWWVNGAYLGPYDTYEATTSTPYSVGEIHALESSGG